jgi:chromosome partitioning protein
MIVLLGGLKGGTGKSTLATNLAALRALDGHEVLLIDADSQGSAAFWAEIRDESGIKPRVPCVQKRGRRIHDEIKEMSGKFGTIVIDAGGRDNPGLRSSMLAADLLIVPTKASQYDLTSLEDLAVVIEDCLLINPKLKTLVVINMAHANPQVSEGQEAKEYLGEVAHIDLAETVIRDRIIFRKSSRTGRSILEMKPSDPKAASEIKAIYEEVFRGGV